MPDIALNPEETTQIIQDKYEKIDYLQEYLSLTEIK